MTRNVSRARAIAIGVLAACISASNLQAQNAAPASTAPIVLKAAHIFDATNGTLRANGIVVVQGEKILSSGVASDVQSPAGAQVIDLGNATLLPGFIDSHTHLTDNLSEENWAKGRYDDLMRFPSEKALYA